MSTVERRLGIRSVFQRIQEPERLVVNREEIVCEDTLQLAVFHDKVFDAIRNGTDKMCWRATPCSLVRKGNWKLMQFFETGTTELYNIKQDIGEANDLAASHPGKVQELLKMPEKWQAETTADIPETINPDFDPDYIPTAEDGAEQKSKQGGWTVSTKEMFLARQKKLAEEKGFEFNQAKAEARFDMRDKNKDGMLTGDEKPNTDKTVKQAVCNVETRARFLCA